MDYLVIIYITYFSLVQAWSPTYRLQNDVIPKSYSLYVTPDISYQTYTGEVTILVELTESTRNITLNTVGTTILHVLLDQACNTTGFALDDKNQFLHIFHKNREYINPGEHIIGIKFAGDMAYKREGLHMSYYDTYSSKGFNDINSAVTLFSPTNARTAFPCFDEPSYRSIFSIRVVKPSSEYTIISNMKQIASFNVSKGIAVDFQSTIPMPVYLVAFFVIKYKDYTETTFKYKEVDIPIRVYSPNANIHSRDFALNATKNALKYFTEYTNISYLLPKLDLVEIPGYGTEAMENWGAISFAQNALLPSQSDVSKSKLEFDIQSALVIAHEVSHNWFGNLVTHKWYNDLWLTEGVAKYMENKATVNFLKNAKIMEILPYTVLDNIFMCQENFYQWQPVVKFDSYLGEHAKQLIQYVYEKGAGILQMLEFVMGENKFQEGMRAYLNKHKHSSATTGDFINAMQSAIPDVNIRTMLLSWLYQGGYPLLNVTEDEKTKSYIIKQQQFKLFENEYESSEALFGFKWTIPIGYTTSTQQNYSLTFFDKDMDYLSIPIEDTDKWFKINDRFKGLYRTTYDKKLYTKLVKHFKDLNADDRGHLISESHEMFRELKIPCEYTLQFIEQVKNDFEYIPTLAALRSLENIMYMYDGNTENETFFKEFFISVFENHYNKFTWTVDEHTESISYRLTRIQVLKTLCRTLSFQKCLNKIDEVKKNNKTVHNDLNTLVIDNPEGDIMQDDEPIPLKLSSDDKTQTLSNNNDTNIKPDSIQTKIDKTNSTGFKFNVKEKNLNENADKSTATDLRNPEEKTNDPYEEIQGKREKHIAKCVKWAKENLKSTRN